MNKTNIKVAVIHDWLPLIGGAERVLEQILKVYPDADVYTLFDFLTDEERQSLGIKNVTTSYLNRLPKVKKYYRNLFPCFPLAIEDFDLSAYDLVISSSHAVAKGVITGAHQVHISYVHSPVRYAWDMTHHYLKQTKLHKGLKGLLAKKLLSNFRLWDYRTPNGVDRFMANSHYIKNRIWKVYRRDSDIVYPPTDIDGFTFQEKKDDFYLTASRMVPYKRLDLIAQAFTHLPDKQLIIIGDGPEMDKIRSIADTSSNVKLLGYQETPVLRDHMQRAKAFLFAAEEDFGIIPVEAQACGTPVIAYGAGGALETVIGYDTDPKNATGVFFEDQTPESLAKAIAYFETIDTKIKPKNCRKNAETFSVQTFQERLRTIAEEEMSKKESSKRIIRA